LSFGGVFRVIVNRQRRLMALVWAAILATASFGCSRSPTTADEVIERHTKAMGGRAAIEAVQSIEFDLHITDPKFEVDGTYFAARPGKMRIDVNAGGEHVFTEAFDGRKGWQWEGKGSAQKAATEKATAALRHGVELPGKLFGLHELEARGHRIELAGREPPSSSVASIFGQYPGCNSHLDRAKPISKVGKCSRPRLSEV
jgi:hypothetical protein